MNTIRVKVKVPINKAHAWEYYFNQINNWWPKKYHSSLKTKKFLIETFVGGRVFEDFGEGDGQLWGRVIGVDYLNSIDIRGNLTRAFGGPAFTFEKVSFGEGEGETELLYELDAIGSIDEDRIKKLENGWKELLQVYFKNYCLERENK